MPLGASPRKKHIYHWKTARAQGKTGRIAVAEMVKAKLTPRDRDAPLVGTELETKRSPD